MKTPLGLLGGFIAATDGWPARIGAGPDAQSRAAAPAAPATAARAGLWRCGSAAARCSLLLLFPQRGLLLRKQLQEQLLLEKPELLRVRGAACDCRCSGGGGAGRRRGLTHRARGGRKRQQQRTRGLAGGVTGSLAAPTSESTLPSGTTLFSLKAFVSPRCLSSRSSATSSTGFSPVAEKQGPFQLQVHSVAP